MAGQVSGQALNYGRLRESVLPETLDFEDYTGRLFELGFAVLCLLLMLSIHLSFAIK